MLFSLAANGFIGTMWTQFILSLYYKVHMDVAFLLAAFSYLSIKIFSRELIKPLSAFVRKNYLLDKITDTRRAHLASKV